MAERDREGKHGHMVEIFLSTFYILAIYKYSIHIQIVYIGDKSRPAFYAR
jgi:hypothetical protein